MRSWGGRVWVQSLIFNLVSLNKSPRWCLRDDSRAFRWDNAFAPCLSFAQWPWPTVTQLSGERAFSSQSQGEWAPGLKDHCSNWIAFWQGSLTCLWILWTATLTKRPVNLFLNCFIFPRSHCLLCKCCKTEKCSLSKMQMWFSLSKREQSFLPGWGRETERENRIALLES